MIASNQHHLLKVWERLKNQGKGEKFMDQLQQIDFETLDSLYFHMVKNQTTNLQIQGATQYQFKDALTDDLRSKYMQDGLSIIRVCHLKTYLKQNKVALVLLAGGKSSRFDDKIKSLSDVGLPSSKPLIKILFERLKKVLTLAQEDDVDSEKLNDSCNHLPLAILVNERNEKKIRQNLSLYNNYGLRIKPVSYCYQKMLGVVNNDGQLLFKKEEKFLTNPTGTGDVFTCLKQINFIEQCIKEKVEYIHFLGTENLLALPLDPISLALLQESGADMIQKYIQLDEHNDQYGVYMAKNNHGKIELQNQSSQQYLMNDLYIKTEFLQSITQNQKKSLQMAQQYHIIKRELPVFDHEAQQLKTIETMHFETFLQDILNISNSVLFQEVQMKEQYAPLIVEADKEKAIKKMSTLHKKWLNLSQTSKIISSLQQADDELVEISPSISYNGELIKDSQEKYRQDIITFPFLIS